eukprot:gnl/TRDRNA2_/TRDRNA2_176083_c0_seq22.p1 gnl/TRDRNA2_/TRDRNA2_176083_c0~~gnl/TRDRNA2_/TRDRNA2_176083_c0_seq22.p1  ORF type:complete len:231 (-),score=37.13 gnl/TRDRNA2_/TRDRNA2_176083_c0_seq22:364-1056(-)
MAATDGKGTANAKDVVESDLGKDVPQVESYESAKHSDASQPKTDVSLADLVGLSLEDPSVAPVRNPLVTHGEEIPKIYFYRRPLEPGETSTTEINIYNAPRVSYDFNHLKGKGDEFRRSILPPGDMLILKCKHYTKATGSTQSIVAQIEKLWYVEIQDEGFTVASVVSKHFYADKWILMKNGGKTVPEFEAKHSDGAADGYRWMSVTVEAAALEKPLESLEPELDLAAQR